MKRLQLLSFEIGRTCNLAAAHPWCPVNVATRHSGPDGILDGEILAFAESAKGAGFGGLVAFHYYNEPMLQLPRVVGLAVALREMLGLYCGLWTNGELIDPAALEWVNAFDKVWITDHNPARKGFYQSLVLKFPGTVHRKSGGHDDRLAVAAAPGRKPRPCWRPTITEMIVDNAGDVHLCCTDWPGETKIGNIRQQLHDGILSRWQEAAAGASAGTLPVCGKCRGLRRSAFVGDPAHRI